MYICDYTDSNNIDQSIVQKNSGYDKRLFVWQKQRQHLLQKQMIILKLLTSITGVQATVEVFSKSPMHSAPPNKGRGFEHSLVWINFPAPQVTEH